ncbi:MAG: helix-turn-helix domain-containing protein [Bacteroidota bacterium]
MEIVLNAGLGIGVFMFFLLLLKKEKEQGDFLFLGWIAVTLLQIIFYEITIYNFALNGIWAILGFGLPLLGAPLLFLYILSLTGHRVSWKTSTAHLGIYGIYVVCLFVLQHKDAVSLTAVNGYFEMANTSPKWMNYYAIPLAISGFVYCLWDLFLLRRHRTTIAELFSFDEKINLKWLKYVVYSYFILFVLASFLIFGATQFKIIPIQNAFALVGITLSIMLIAFGFYGFRQTAIFSGNTIQDPSLLELDAPSLKKAAYSKSGLTTKKVDELGGQLMDYMKFEKPFLDEDLSLSLLSEKSGINPSHLSQVINQHFDLNFYDFVNQYRVAEAKKMLSSRKFDHLSVLGIAYDCGFKSKSSFNRYFKKYTSLSPSEYKKKNSQ